MMKNTHIVPSILLAAAVSLASCSRQGAKVSGQLAGIEKKTVYLEQLLPGSKQLVDSAATDEKGNFSLKVRLPEGEASIYNLRCGNDLVPLLLAPGEKAVLHAENHSYTVSGSPGSELMREVHTLLAAGASKLDSLAKAYDRLDAADKEDAALISRQYGQEFMRLKREQIRFIVTNPSSLAAVYALYQRLPGDRTLFNGDTDVVYFRMVADSLEVRQPASPYVAALRGEVERMDKRLAAVDYLNNTEVKAVGFPDIELPDIYGNRIKLSSLEGRVIVLDFWSASSPNSRMLNAELKQLYAQLAPRGMAVYQVSVDVSRTVWVEAVQSQKLPWPSVCDLKGARGPAVMLYNVSEVPTNFVIDRAGNIVARNLFGDALANKIKSLL